MLAVELAAVAMACSALVGNLTAAGDDDGTPPPPAWSVEELMALDTTPGGDYGRFASDAPAPDDVPTEEIVFIPSTEDLIAPPEFLRDAVTMDEVMVTDLFDPDAPPEPSTD